MLLHLFGGLGTSLSQHTARVVAAPGLALLLIGDVWAIRVGKFFPLTLRRQTRKQLMYTTHTDRFVGFAWGIDAGVAVLTYRMTSGIWVICLLAVVGLASEYTVLGYSVGFATAIAVIVLWPTPPGTPHSRAEAAVRRVDGLVGMGRVARVAYSAILAVSTLSIVLQDRIGLTS